MRSRLMSLAAIVLTGACSDQPLNDERLVGPVMSSRSPAGAAISSAQGPTGGSSVSRSPTIGTNAAVAGSRMIWDPEKPAFRVGQVNGAHWDDANNGSNSIAMGFNTQASQNSVAFGYITLATGQHSTAMGSHASTFDKEGAFVYGDNSTGFQLQAPADNSFTVRAAGGVTFYSSSDLSTGCNLPTGSGTWACVSDVNTKENFREEDGEHVLQALTSLPVPSWNYKTEDSSIRHLGPMAQDFHAAFGLGHDDRYINTVDIDGVNMLAVQALEKRTRELSAENERLRVRVVALEAAFQRFKATGEFP